MSDSDSGAGWVFFGMAGLAFWVGLGLVFFMIIGIVVLVALGAGLIYGLFFALATIPPMKTRGWMYLIGGTVAMFMGPFVAMYYLVFGQSFVSVNFNDLAGWQQPIPPICFIWLVANCWLAHHYTNYVTERYAIEG